MRLIFFLPGVKRLNARSSIVRPFISPTLLKSSYREQAQRMASTLPSTPIFNAIAKHDPKSLAIIHSASDRSFCYGSLLHDVAAAKDNLTSLAKGNSLKGERIAFLAENGYDYVGTYDMTQAAEPMLTLGE
jgi:hypothetical protein